MDTIVGNNQQDLSANMQTMNDLPEVQVEEIEQPEQLETDHALRESAETPDEIQDTPRKKDPNQSFKELRAQKEEAERRYMEQQRYINDLEQRARMLQPQQPQSPSEPEPSDSDLVEYRHVKAQINKLKGELDGFKQQTVAQQQENALRSKYPDIDSVITPENVQQLRRLDPDGARAMDEASTLYAKGLLAYRLIKAQNINQDESEYVPQQKINKNAGKPRSIATVNPSRGQTPLNNANAYMEFNDEIAAQLEKEMNLYSKMPRQ